MTAEKIRGYISRRTWIPLGFGISICGACILFTSWLTSLSDRASAAEKEIESLKGAQASQGQMATDIAVIREKVESIERAIATDK